MVRDGGYSLARRVEEKEKQIARPAQHFLYLRRRLVPALPPLFFWGWLAWQPRAKIIAAKLWRAVSGILSVMVGLVSTV